MNDSRRLIRFAVVGAVLGVIWYFLYYNVVLPDGRFDSLLGRFIAQLGVGVLHLCGFVAGRAPGTALISVEGDPSVIVGWQCNGMPLYALFAIFIIAYPGPWRVKAWFVPAGVAAIFLVNLVRVVALALNHHYWRDTMEFNHHYTFLLLVYGFIFWLWTIWVKRYGASLSGGPAPVSAGEPASSASADGR